MDFAPHPLENRSMEGLPFGPSFYDIKINFWGFTQKAIMGHESRYMCKIDFVVSSIAMYNM
jgi:hypothetical protein